MEDAIDSQGLLWLVLSLVIVFSALTCGAWWLDIHTVLREWVGFFRNWEVVHEDSRTVDCTPWGLKKSFTLAQEVLVPVLGPGPDFMAPPALPDTGLCVWNGGVALSRWLTEERQAKRSGAFARGKSIVELGCGQALVSMVASELFSGLKHIVATDGSEDVLRSAEANISTNLDSGANGIELELLRWGRREDIDRVLARNDGRGYDAILCADVTYMETHFSLLSTILELSHESTELYVTHEPRRRSMDSLVARLREDFRSVTEVSMDLSPEEASRSESVRIICWHCVGRSIQNL